MPYFWLALLVLFVIIEASTTALTTIWAAISALVMIFISRTGLAFRWQMLIFLVLTILLMLGCRPFAIKKLKLGREKTNVDSLVGEEILITKAITAFHKGEAKSKNGVIWAVSSDKEISAGSVCVVEKVKGNTLIVRKKGENAS